MRRQAIRVMNAAVASGWLLLFGCARTLDPVLPPDLQIAAYEIALREAHRHVLPASTIALGVAGGHASSRAVDAVEESMADHPVREGECDRRDEQCLELRLEARARTRRDHTVRIWSIRRNSASWCEYTFREDGRVWTGVRNDACGGVIGDDFHP